MNTSRRNWRRCATRLFPSCTRVVCLEECQEERLGASLVELEPPLAQPLRRSTETTFSLSSILIYLKRFNSLELLH